MSVIGPTNPVQALNCVFSIRRNKNSLVGIGAVAAGEHESKAKDDTAIQNCASTHDFKQEAETLPKAFHISSVPVLQCLSIMTI
jgi:hypothetical protein